MATSQNEIDLFQQAMATVESKEAEAQEKWKPGVPLGEREFVRRGVEGDLDPKYFGRPTPEIDTAKLQMQEKQDAAQRLGYQNYTEAFAAIRDENPELSLVQTGTLLKELAGETNPDPVDNMPSDPQKTREDFSERDVLDLFERSKGPSIRAEDGVGEQAWKKFVTATTFTYNAGTLASAATGLAGEWQWKNPLNLFTHRIVGSEEIYGPEFKDMSFDERRVAIKARRDNQINEFYGHIATGDSPWAEGAGTFAGYMADPTTALPIGQTMTKAALIGGGIVGGDVALHQWYETGEVDASTVAIGIALGAVLGPIIKYVGGAGAGKVKDFMSRAKDKAARGEPMTADEVIDAGAGSAEPMDRSVAQKFADEFNTKFELTPEGNLNQAIRIANRTFEGKADVNLLSPEEAIVHQRLAAQQLEGKLTAKQFDQAVKNEEVHSALNGTKFDGPEQIKRDVDAAFAEPYIITPTSKSIRKTKDPKKKAAKIAKAIEETGRRNAERMMAEGNPLRIAIIEANARRATHETDDFLSTLPRDEAGNVTPETLKNFGVGTWSPNTGNAEKDILRAMTFEDIPTGTKVGRELWGNINKMDDPDIPMTGEKAKGAATATEMWKWTQRPTARFLQIFGRKGKILNEVLERQNEDIRWWTSQSSKDIDEVMDAIKGLSRKESSASVANVLRGSVKPSQVAPAVAKAAAFVRKSFNTAVRLARAHGVLTAKEAEALIAKAAKEGYYPHVYNRPYLDSSKGQAHWGEVMTKHNWTEKQLQSVLTTIKRANPAEKGRVISEFKKNGDFYVMDRDTAKKILKNQQTNQYGAKSGHLEESRTINLPEEVLRPFLLDDVRDVTTEYFRDVYRRIASAKYFGKDYERVGAFVEEVGKYPHVTKVDTDNVWEIVWGMAGDAKSRVLQDYMDIPAGQRAMLSKITAYETFKLTFAQTLNMAQAVINSQIILANRVGIPRGVKILVKGIIKTLSAANRRHADRIGASAETTLMEMAGELGGGVHMWSTKFLKGTGFMAVEKLQRRLAANMGKAYIEDLVEERAKLLLKQRTRKLTTKESSQLKKHTDGMTEMGISLREGDPRISMHDVNRGMQRFSNSVNFNAAVHKLPIGTQGPYWKVARQFKSFAFFTGALVKDNVIKPLMRGNLQPAIVLMGAGGIGMQTDALRRFLKADDKEYTLTERYGRGFMAIGGMGILLDTIRQFEYGGASVALSLAGPAAGDISKIGETAWKAGKNLVEGEEVWGVPQTSKLARDLFVLPAEGVMKDKFEGGAGSTDYKSLYKRGGK